LSNVSKNDTFFEIQIIDVLLTFPLKNEDLDNNYLIVNINLLTLLLFILLHF